MKEARMAARFYISGRIPVKQYRLTVFGSYDKMVEPRIIHTVCETLDEIDITTVITMNYFQNIIRTLNT
jgi:hypothetical protein